MGTILKFTEQKLFNQVKKLCLEPLELQGSSFVMQYYKKYVLHQMCSKLSKLS